MSEKINSARTKLRVFKDRLLDLTARNRMINSRFNSLSKQHFRIIDEIPQEIYFKLQNSSMTFNALPPVKNEPPDEKKNVFKDALTRAHHTDLDYQEKLKKVSGDPDAESKLLRKLKDKVREELGWEPFLGKDISPKDHAKKNQINPDYNLPKENIEDEKKYTDSKIQTLFFQDDLKRYIEKIKDNYNSSLKESGVNPLYFCFGFIEWKQAESSDKILTSPVLMLQVHLLEGERGRKLKVSSTGDEISVNLTLNEKLKKELRTELPALPEILEDEEFSIEDYFEQIQELSKKKNWTFRRWISFGIYNAQNMPIYKDIDKMAESDSLSPLLQQLLLGTKNDRDEGDSSEIYDIDTEEIQQKVPALVKSADSSQFSAVVDAVNEKNIVLKGPPGTGKSQTITNIIAALCAEGKKVLFVAQKQAALDVVRNNLEAIGSQNFLLEIFSIKANKKAVMESIRVRNNIKQPKIEDNFQKDLKKLELIKKELNFYSAFLNEPYRNTEKSIHEILWDQVQLDDSLLERFDGFEVPEPDNISDFQLENCLEELNLLKKLCANYFADFNIFNKEIRRITKQINEPSELDKKINELNHINDLFTVCSNHLLELENKNHELSEKSFEELMNTRCLQVWHKNDKPDLKKMIDFLITYDDISIIKEYIEEKENYSDARDKFEDDTKFVSKTFDLDIDKSFYNIAEIKNSAKLLTETNFFSYFKKEWWEAKKIFNSFCILEKKDRTFSHKIAGRELNKFFVYINKKDDAEEKINYLKGIVDKKEQENLNTLDKVTLNYLYDIRGDIKDIINELNILGKKFVESWGKKPEIVDEYIKLIGELSSYENQIIELFDSFGIVYDDLIPNNPLFLESYEPLKDFINKLTNQTEYFTNYMRFITQEDQISNKNVEDFYRFFNKAEQDIENIDKFYKYFVRKAQKDHIFKNNHEDIAKYDGVKINLLRSKLDELDKDVERKYQKEIANKIYKYGLDAPIGETGLVRDKTNMALVNHLSTVSQPKMSIREFMDNASDAVLALMPCSLMSPLTVSQTLPYEEMFDVVVIDEASQMKPEYALGAVARAKQMIIVGDPKQLPPTTFYQSTSSEDDWDDDYGDESILDMAMTVLFPPRELLWHYRSRHQDLIRFSNAKFYQNLLIPVTANNSNNALRGIDYKYQESAVYKSRSSAGGGGINVIEGEAIVEEALKLMIERPNESIGIATMNIKQRDYIQSEFDLRKSRDPKILEYLGMWEEKNEGLEEFFIKNLENVQGDERDIILISTVYGPDEEGKVFQRFGPINGIHGARRLNVLFSRAKNQIKLFTSLKASDIKVTDSSAEGLSVLKDYLTYVETDCKILNESRSSSHEIESPFQKWAIDMINSFPGFKARHEIGVKGYRIDIAVSHEDYPHGYIMAVETDGASYHSSHSARDRDKLRQEILESHGWVFYRIWSTDYFYNPLKEKEKLQSALEERLKELLSPKEPPEEIIQNDTESEQTSDDENQVHFSEDLESELEIDSRWDIDTIQKHLIMLYGKWNGRISTLPEGSRRENAQRILNLIAEARKKYS